MKITVVRHGQTNYNVAGLHNSDPSIDVHLTNNGIDEAKQVALKLKDEPFDALFVSELPRTRQTAEYINEYHKLPILVDARLNDINTGFEGGQFHNTIKNEMHHRIFTHFVTGMPNLRKMFINGLKRSSKI